MSYFIVPEIQYWFNKFILSCKLNREKIPFPVTVPISSLHRQSFIELLFNDSYSESEYKYLYMIGTSPPNVVTRRMMVYPNTRYYEVAIIEEDGENLFDLDSNDLLILDKLLEYRLDPVNTTLEGISFDSTSFDSTATDSTSEFINYDTLENEQSETYTVQTSKSILYNLIYLYLDLQINGNTSNYDNMALLSKNNTGVIPREVLECCFEAYLIEKMFLFTSLKAI